VYKIQSNTQSTGYLFGEHVDYKGLATGKQTIKTGKL